MKTAVALLAITASTVISLAQIAPAPGTPPAAQAQQAFAVAQARTMMMTNQAQVQGMIFAQASMLNSVQARSMFMSMAGSLQLNATINQQGAMFAAMAAMHRSQALRNQFAIQSAILRLRNQGTESAPAMQGAVRAALSDPAKSFRVKAMLHAQAAQASGQTGTNPGALQTPAPDTGPVSAEPPPMMIRPTFGNPMTIDKPTFSVESGKVDAGTKVRIKCETHYATIYYTTNGWTPTTQSAKYAGPITVNYNTHLEAIAVGPNLLRSSVEQIEYKVPGSAAPAPESSVAVPEDGVLRAGTPIRVSFAENTDSEAAQVGDEPKLVLDEDIKQGSTVLAAKGSPVSAALTNADPSSFTAPGDLVFEIHSVDIAGKHVPLFGGETLEGPKPGKNATIKAGTTALAFVAADTPMK
jgi:hypothetical protein